MRMEPATISVQAADAPAPRASTFWQALAAPWLIFSPARAARAMAEASRPAFWSGFGLGSAALGVVLVGLFLWEDTVYRDWTEQTRRTGVRSITEVWSAWHAEGPIGPAELGFLLTLGLAPILTAIGAWLYLPNAHCGGSGWRSYKRAYRGVASGIGLLGILVLAVGAPIVWLARMDNLGARFADEAVMTLVIATFACLAGLLYWLTRATQAVAVPEAPVDLPPRCEGCGYDLTHQSAEGRCTECGLDIASSLTPEFRRPGCRWQRKRHLYAWVVTSFDAICSPSQFYGSLRTRTPFDEAARFSRWHYPLMGVLAAVWIFFMIAMVHFRATGKEFIFFPCLMLFLIPLVGWGLHRLVGSAVISYYIVRDELPEVDWGRKVHAYETAFLWVFVLHNGILVSSFFFFQDWISQLFGFGLFGSFGGTPLEPLAVLFSNGLLIIAWFWRYVTAFRNIRWSNF